MSLVSVICPIYNGKGYIPAFLKYFQEQTFQDFEIIFVDDGSHDGSYELLQQYADGQKIKLFQQQHNGQAAARNFGLEKTTSDFIVFCDMDDEFYPTYLELMYKTLAALEDIDFLKCGVDIDLPGIKPEWQEIIENVLPSNTMFRKRIFNFIRGFPVDDVFKKAGCGEDDCFFAVIRNVFNGAKIKDVLMKFVRKDGNTLDRFSKVYTNQPGSDIRQLLSENEIQLLAQRDQKIRGLLAEYKQKVRKIILNLNP